ncbi:hypothetical protein CKO12_03770 [Chromatium okenii]|nr:hypothetical protein [Chromatium okenii]
MITRAAAAFILRQRRFYAHQRGWHQRNQHHALPVGELGAFHRVATDAQRNIQPMFIKRLARIKFQHFQIAVRISQRRPRCGWQRTGSKHDDPPRLRDAAWRR